MSIEAWSAQTLAERLDVPLSTVRHWRTTGNGPPGYKVGRFIRYLSSDVEDWVLSRPVRGHSVAHGRVFPVKRPVSSPGVSVDGPQIASGEEFRVYACHACPKTVDSHDDAALRALGWTQRDDKWLCTACSYTQ